MFFYIKVIKFRFILLILITQLSIKSNAKIDSLAIIPQNPTLIDTVKVVVYITWGNTGCNISDSIVTKNNSKINVTGFHSEFGFSAVTSCVDTITIGKLNGGIYELIYHANSDYYTDITYATDTINFSVLPLPPDTTTNDTLWVNENKIENIKINPNPVNTVLTVKVDKTYQINLYDSFGKLIYCSEIDESTHLINTAKYKNGIYHIMLQNEKELVHQKLLIQH